MTKKHQPLLPLLFLFCCCVAAQAWQGADDKRKQAVKEEKDKIHWEADNHRFNEFEDNAAQRLSGNVVFRHGGMTMYCDSALLYEASESFDAFGHVRIVQGDTLELTGDVLHYYGENLMAEMRYNVVMTHRNQILKTDSLNYDRLYNVSYYFEGGRLIDGTSVLESDWGEYHTDTKQSVFNYNVVLTDEDFKLVTDTLHYDTQTKWSKAIGPTNIYSNDDRIYTELGYYNTESEQARLYDRTMAFGRDRIMSGDTVYYDKTTGVMEAFNNISCEDTKNKNILTGDYCIYFEQTGEAMATKRALAREFSQGPDTLYVHADTIRMFTYNIDTDSVYRKLHGYFHVRAYRTDVQAVSDSLVFNSKEGKLTLYKDPIVWSDTKQVLGEEINVYMADSTIDSIYVERQALMVEQLDSVHFNQVTSQEMHSYFENGEMRENQAVGNVLTIFYPLEKDSTILYSNYLETSILKMFMKERKLDRLWAPASPVAVLYPIGMAPPDRRQLANFVWFDYIRPLNKDDIYEWRPKKAGTELKPSIRRTPPLQKLEGKKKK